MPPRVIEPRVDFTTNPDPSLQCGDCPQRLGWLWTLGSLHNVPPFYLLLEGGFAELPDDVGRWRFTGAALARVAYDRPAAHRGLVAYEAERQSDMPAGEYHPLVLQFPATIVCPGCAAMNVFIPNNDRLMYSAPEPARAVALLMRDSHPLRAAGMRIYYLTDSAIGRADRSAARS